MLSDNAASLRSGLLHAMGCVVRICGTPEARGENCRDKELVQLARKCVTNAVDLNLQLTALLLLHLARFSFIVTDSGLAQSGSMFTKALGLLRCPAVQLPSITRLGDESREVIARMLSAPIDVDGFCRGEAVVGSLATLREAASVSGESVALSIIFLGAVTSFSKRRDASNGTTQTQVDACPFVDAAIASLRSLAKPGASIEDESAALRGYYSAITGMELPRYSERAGEASANQSASTTMRLLCMVDCADGMPALLEAASQQVDAGEWGSLQREIAIGEMARPAESRLLLRGTSEMLRECIHSALAEGSDAERALGLGLAAMSRLYRTARSMSLQQESDGSFKAASKLRLEIDAVNAARLVSVGGAEALVDARFSIRERVGGGAFYFVVESNDPSDLVSASYTGSSQGTVERLKEVLSAAMGGSGNLADEATQEKLVVITDAGKDNDDELALILCRAMSEMNLIDLKAVVANLAPSAARAKLARGTLDALGMRDVAVAAGSDGNSNEHPDNFTSTVAMTGCDYLVREPELDGVEVLLRTYESAEPASLTLVLISSLLDAAEFIEQHEELFAAKTARVAIMGGVVPTSLQGTQLEPDRSAANHRFDMAATEVVYRRCQELGVSLVVLTRSAAYAASVPAFIYDELASLGHPVALRLRESQRKAIDALFKRAVLPKEDPGRLGLPERCDRSWFSQTFCGGAELASVGSDDGRSVWPYVTSLVMYDALALLSAHPATLDAFFEVGIKEVNGVEHCVVGTSDDHPGVRDANKLRSFLMDSFRCALSSSLEEVRTHTKGGTGTSPPRLARGSKTHSTEDV